MLICGTARGHSHRYDKLTPRDPAHLRQLLEVVLELSNAGPDNTKIVVSAYLLT